MEIPYPQAVSGYSQQISNYTYKNRGLRIPIDGHLSHRRFADDMAHVH